MALIHALGMLDIRTIAEAAINNPKNAATQKNVKACKQSFDYI